jgi:hypothetical protein
MRSGRFVGHGPSLRKSASLRKNTFWHPSVKQGVGSSSIPTVNQIVFVRLYPPA